MNKDLTNHIEINGKNFPKKGTKGELESYGLRYLKTNPHEVDGTKRMIEYLIYQDNTQIVVWRKLTNEGLFEIHTEAEITKRH